MGSIRKITRQIPDVVLGQHVVNIRAGHVATCEGYSLAGKNVFEVRLRGRGGHGSAPQDCIDPVVLAAYILVRLQGIISRELDPNKMALITCGSIHAGDAPNVIPDEAILKVDIRAYNPTITGESQRRMA
jgi:metal-dependent amidase/aminoacylase/carboxypeptidase family protein